jgi:hypothetical protein
VRLYLADILYVRELPALPNELMRQYPSYKSRAVGIRCTWTRGHAIKHRNKNSVQRQQQHSTQNGTANQLPIVKIF